MGIETLVGASLAVSATSAGVGMAGASAQARAQSQAAAEQVRAAEAQKQQSAIERQVQQSELALARAAAADGQRAASLSATATRLAAAEANAAAGVTRNDAARLVAEAEAIGASSRINMATLAMQEATVRRRSVQDVARVASQANRALGQARVLVAEAGLSGTSVDALMREVSVVSGAEANRTLADTNDALQSVALERNKVRLTTMSQLLDLTGRQDRVAQQGVSNAATQGRIALQGEQDAIQSRRADMAVQQVELNGVRNAAGLATRDIQIDSQIRQIEIGQRAASQQMTTSMIQSGLGVLQSGLQIGASYVGRQEVAAARAEDRRFQLELYRTGRGA